MKRGTRTKQNSNGSTGDAPRAAWGLAIAPAPAPARVELVRVERQPDGSVRVERRQVPADASVLPDGSPTAALSELLATLPPDEPLGVSVPDRWTMCRGMSLPRVAPQAMQKMIAAQAEATLSGGDGRLSWTSRDFANPFDAQTQWVLLCAARRELVDRLQQLRPQVRAVVPRAVLDANAVARPGTNGAVRIALDVTDGAATLSLLAGQRLMRCIVVEEDEQSLAPVAPTPSWVAEVRQAYQSLLDGVPRDARPKHGTVRAESPETTARLIETLSAPLGLELTDAPASSDDSSAAIAAARLALGDTSAAHEQPLNFARPPQDETSSGQPRPRRLAWLAAACVAGVLVLYGLDVARASWLTRQLDQLRTAETASSGIERRLDVDRFLEHNASPVLPGLDAILGAAPPSLMLSSFSLSTTGQFRLQGAVGSGAELDQFLRKLQDSRALTHVELRSARVENNRWSIELTADATPMAGLLLNNAAPKAEAKPPPMPQTPGARTREDASEAAGGAARAAHSATSRPTTTKTSTTTRGAP